MNFFKNIFSRNKKEENTKSTTPKIEGIYSDEYFNGRYAEDLLMKDDVLVDGSIKMIEGYFIDNNIVPAIKSPVYHPATIDQAVNDGLGFHQYCKLFDQDDQQIGLALTIAFSYYMIKEHGFKLYRDTTPEFPLRFMTLKYNNDGGVISLYPFEYSLKVLNGESSFNELLERIKANLKTIPTASEFVDSIKKNLSEDSE